MKWNRLSCLCSAVIALSAHVCLATVQETVGYTINGSAGFSGGGGSFQPFFKTYATASEDPHAEVTLDSGYLGVDSAGGDAVGKAGARAAQGSLGVEAHSLSTSAGYLIGGNVTVQSTAIMRDTWTMTVGFQDGALLHVMAAFKLDGSQTVTANGADHQPGGYMDTVTADASSALYVSGSGVLPGPYANGAYALDRRDMNTNAVDTNIHLAPPQYVYFEEDFLSGVPQSEYFMFELDQGGSVFSNAFNKGGSSQADAQFSHTLVWDGITSVTDQNGNVVNDWTLTTESGVDYAHAIQIPEPSTGAMLLAALPITFLLRRRKSTGTTRRR